MAYNRWIYDDLEHSGVLNMKWYHRNGPPYPLDRSLSDGKRLLPKATGSPQGKKRTPARGGVSKSGKKDQIHSDYGDSLAARAKRKYEDYKKTRAEERARDEESEKKLYAEQSDRLNKLNITKETREKLEDEAKYYEESHGASKGSALKRALDDYEKRTSDIKEHGTADEVLKNRERFSKEDMDYISSRLEAEAKIRQFSSKPVEQIQVPKTERDLIYETASAKEVYRNRTELTVEQLETVQRRLNAENKIGEIASKQVDLDSKNMERLKKVRDVLRVLGDSADSIAKIQKILPKNNQNQNNNNNNNNRAAQAVETGRRIFGLVNVVRDVSNSYNQGNQNNQQRQNQGNQNNQQQGNQQRQNQNQGNQQRQNQGNQQQNNTQTQNRHQFVQNDPRAQSSDEYLRRTANGYRDIAERDRQSAAAAENQGRHEAANASRARAERNQAEADKYENELRRRNGQAPLNNSQSGNNSTSSNTQQRQTSNSSGSNTQQRQTSNSNSTRSSTQQSQNANRSSNTTQRSSVSDLIDRLSTIEVVMTDESRNGKVDPLEQIGRTFTDEERKRR